MSDSWQSTITEARNSYLVQPQQGSHLLSRTWQVKLVRMKCLRTLYGSHIEPPKPHSQIMNELQPLLFQHQKEQLTAAAIEDPTQILYQKSLQPTSWRKLELNLKFMQTVLPHMVGHNKKANPSFIDCKVIHNLYKSFSVTKAQAIKLCTEWFQN